jgi:BirA family biotin operon repressor/biotin-[acetyl-CoA-carboxylase] ligase
VIPTEEWNLDTVRIGRRVLVFDRVDSTNNVAAQSAHDQANDGLVFLAGEQTAGRGQHGRSWMCQPNMGVLLSVLIFPEPALRRPVILAAWAANAVCETIQTIAGRQAQIKWPNDVLVAGRKVCGILIEQNRGTVVGIGLNVNQSAAYLAEANLPQAASLACFTGDVRSVHDVAKLLIDELDRQYQELCQGDLVSLETAWRRRTALVGRRVFVECANSNHSGRLQSLSFEGLELDETEEGILRLQPEMVKHIVPQGTGTALPS